MNKLLIILSICIISYGPLGCRTTSKKELENRYSFYVNQQQEMNKVTVFTKESSSNDIILWWNRSWIKGRALGLNMMSNKLDQTAPTNEKDKSEIYSFKLNGDMCVELKISTLAPGKEMPPYKCSDNRSEIYIKGDRNKLKIDLNPYCDESYDISEVDIAFYWMAHLKYPLVEITTNGPACIPSTLYEYSVNNRIYKKAAFKCGG